MQYWRICHKFTAACHRINYSLVRQRARDISVLSARRATPITQRTKTTSTDASLVLFKRPFIRTQYACQSTKPSVKSLQYDIINDGKVLAIRHSTGKVQRFHSTWLRHNCQCTACLDPVSRQRRIVPAKLESSYTLKGVEISSRDDATGPDSEVRLTWRQDDHVGRMSLSFLLRHGYSAEDLRRLADDRRPSVSKGVLPRLQYKDVTGSERGLWKWLSTLNDVGLTLIKDVPVEEEMVAKVAQTISNVMPTIYGKVFDVQATQNPINIAYSSETLGFHMDLVYYESPPGIQLLHCLRFDPCVGGGESLAVDAWYVAEQLRKSHPEDFATLTRVPATFQKHHFEREQPVCMTYQRPHIVLGHTGQVTNVNWSPPFEGPLCVAEEDVEPYYEAYHRFAELLESSETKVKFRMEVGDLFAFNNRRILHSRNGFNLNGGERHFQGCYVNIDEFKSRVQVLSRTFTDGKPAKDVFNQSVL